MPLHFYRNDYCEVFQPDGQWYRSTIQGGPYVGETGAVYYKVHMHHPINRHGMIWATAIRPDPANKGCSSDCCNVVPQPNIPNVHTTFQEDPAPVPTIQQGACSLLSQGSGVFRRLETPTAAVQPVVPSKRSREQAQQAMPATADAQAVQSPTSGTATPPATVVEPAAKRPTLLLKTSGAQTASQDDSSSIFDYQKPSPALLEGPALEVQIKMGIYQKSWYLPKALLALFSPFFSPTVEKHMDARGNDSIELENFSPTAFATFVQWMYYGTYSPQHAIIGPPIQYHHIDAWILGDQLQTPAFQNCAMSCIFTQYSSWRPLTTSTVLHVCAKTATNTPLRLLLLGVLAQNFTDQARVEGTLEDWDVALQEYPDARLSLLGSFRTQGSRVKPLEDYFVVDKKSIPGRVTRSATAFEAGRLQLNLSSLPHVKSEKSKIKKEPEQS